MNRPTELHFPRIKKVDASKPTIGLESCQQFNHIGTDNFDCSNWGVRRNRIVVIQYTLRGRGCVQYDGKVYEQEPGDCFHIHIKEPHRYWLPREWEQWDFLSFTFDGPQSLELEDRILEQTGPVSHWEDDTLLLDHMWSLYDRVTLGGSIDPFTLSAACYQIFMCILGGTAAEKNAAQLPRPISVAIEYMENNFLKNPTLKEVADIAELSPFHFNRVFKQHTGLTPRKHLEELRLQRAKRLLESSQLNINEVAQSCGYEETAYFSTVFKKRAGMTPGSYRRAHWLE